MSSQYYNETHMNQSGTLVYS